MPSHSSARSTYRNRLLAALSPADQALLSPTLEFKEFEIRHVFESPNRIIQDVYFIERGMASVVAKGHGDTHVEVGLIGCEGVSGLSVILGGDRSPHSTYAQLAGSAHRLGVKDMRAVMGASATLRELLLKFALTFMIQTAQTALSNGRAKLEARLARWLLMGHDRINGDELEFTHEFLSVMLGVRRAGVTVAVNELQQRGLIKHQRNNIQIIDRKGLEKITNGAYGVPEAEYRRLIGPPR